MSDTCVINEQASCQTPQSQTINRQLQIYALLPYVYIYSSQEKIKLMIKTQICFAANVMIYREIFIKFVF